MSTPSSNENSKMSSTHLDITIQQLQFHDATLFELLSQFSKLEYLRIPLTFNPDHPFLDHENSSLASLTLNLNDEKLFQFEESFSSAIPSLPQLTRIELTCDSIKAFKNFSSFTSQSLKDHPMLRFISHRITNIWCFPSSKFKFIISLNK